MRTSLVAVWLFSFLSSVGVPGSSAAPQSDSNSVRKTIEIQASAKVEAPAEIATVKVGYANQAATKDAAYDENTRGSQKIFRALLEARVPPAAIETETLTLEREQPQGAAAPAKIVKYSALQEWRIRVDAADAQKVVDIAVAGGATNIDGVEWDVKDPEALQAKAYAAAIDRAKQVAGQTASSAAIKLGDILAIQNFSAAFRLGGGGGQIIGTETSQVNSVRSVTTVPLTLYPPKIEQQATVRVTYAIAP